MHVGFDMRKAYLGNFNLQYLGSPKGTFRGAGSVAAT